MTYKFSMILFCFYFRMSYAAVLLWSDQEIRVSPLEQFTLKDLTKLTENLERPDVHIFQSPSQLSSVFKEILSGYYSAYTPNGQIESENITCKCLLPVTHKELNCGTLVLSRTKTTFSETPTCIKVKYTKYFCVLAIFFL